MSIQEVKFTPEQRKNLALQLGDVINTEISIMEPIMKAYSNSPYFQSKLENMVNAGIKQRLFDFCSHFGYIGLNITLIFNKSPMSSYMLEDPHYIGTIMNIHYTGDRSEVGMSDVNISDRLIKVDVQPDKWEEAGLYRLNEGAYAAIILQNAYVSVVEEDSNVDTEAEDTASEDVASDTKDVASDESENSMSEDSEGSSEDEAATDGMNNPYDLILQDLLKKGKE